MEGENVLYYLLYNDLPKERLACKLGAAMGSERWHRVCWNRGSRAVNLPVPIGSSTPSTDHADNLLSDIHEPIVAGKDTAQKQAYWFQFRSPRKKQRATL